MEQQKSTTLLAERKEATRPRSGSNLPPHRSNSTPGLYFSLCPTQSIPHRLATARSKSPAAPCSTLHPRKRRRAPPCSHEVRHPATAAMGAKQSVNAGKGPRPFPLLPCLLVALLAWLNRWRRSPVCGNDAAKVDLNVDLTHMLCEALLLPPVRCWLFLPSSLLGRWNACICGFRGF